MLPRRCLEANNRKATFDFEVATVVQGHESLLIADTSKYEFRDLPLKPWHS